MVEFFAPHAMRKQNREHPSSGVLRRAAPPGRASMRNTRLAPNHAPASSISALARSGSIANLVYPTAAAAAPADAAKLAPMRRANEKTTQRHNRPANIVNTADMLGERAYKKPGKA